MTTKSCAIVRAVRTLLSRCLFALSAILVATLTSTVHAELQRADLATIDGQVQESYAGRANVSGAELIGISLGSAIIISDSADIELATPRQTTNRTRLCVRVTTRDGLFWSDNPFHIASTNPAGIAMAGPVAHKHLPELKRYDPEQVIVRVIAMDGDNCSFATQKHVYYPALGNRGSAGSDKIRNLFVYLNTQGRVAIARLETRNQNEETLTVRCEPFEQGAAVAADRECKFEAMAKISGGIYRLRVRVKGRLGAEDSEYALYLPSLR